MQAPLPCSITFGLCFTLPALTIGQCTDQVTHVSGAQMVAGADVTVSSTGTVDVNSVYCSETFPYFIGYNSNLGSGTGSYNFTFVPPITGATFNVSGISEAGITDVEYVRIFINGAHYAVPAPGVQLTCDPLGVLTPDGDIGACGNCGASGMGQITLPGLISTLTVQDTVLIGSPNGAIFSLFICDEATGLDDGVGGTDQAPYPNPATSTILLPRSFGGMSTATLSDVQGRVVRTFQSGAGNLSSLFVGDLPRGTYVLVLNGATSTHHKVVLE